MERGGGEEGSRHNLGDISGTPRPQFYQTLPGNPKIRAGFRALIPCDRPVWGPPVPPQCHPSVPNF